VRANTKPIMALNLVFEGHTQLKQSNYELFVPLLLKSLLVVCRSLGMEISSAWLLSRVQRYITWMILLKSLNS